MRSRRRQRPWARRGAGSYRVREGRECRVFDAPSRCARASVRGTAVAAALPWLFPHPQWAAFAAQTAVRCRACLFGPSPISCRRRLLHSSRPCRWRSVRSPVVPRSMWQWPTMAALCRLGARTSWWPGGRVHPEPACTSQRWASWGAGDSGLAICRSRRHAHGSRARQPPSPSESRWRSPWPSADLAEVHHRSRCFPPGGRPQKHRGRGVRFDPAMPRHRWECMRLGAWLVSARNTERFLFGFGGLSAAGWR